MWHPFDVILSEWWWLCILGTKRGPLLQDFPITAGSNGSQTTTPDGAVWNGREAETGPAEGGPATGSGSQTGSECPDPGVEYGEKGILLLFSYKCCIILFYEKICVLYKKICVICYHPALIHKMNLKVSYIFWASQYCNSAENKTVSWILNAK